MSKMIDVEKQLPEDQSEDMTGTYENVSGSESYLKPVNIEDGNRAGPTSTKSMSGGGQLGPNTHITETEMIIAPIPEKFMANVLTALKCSKIGTLPFSSYLHGFDSAETKEIMAHMERRHTLETKNVVAIKNPLKNHQKVDTIVKGQLGYLAERLHQTESFTACIKNVTVNELARDDIADNIDNLKIDKLEVLTFP
jgi:hypothetical protein